MKKTLLAFKNVSKRIAGAVTKLQWMQGGMQVGYNGTKISSIRMGTLTLVAGLATVADSFVTAASTILLARQTSGGTVGMEYEITSRTAGTGFNVTSRSAAGTTQTSDTSTLAYFVIEP